MFSVSLITTLIFIISSLFKNLFIYFFYCWLGWVFAAVKAFL